MSKIFKNIKNGKIARLGGAYYHIVGEPSQIPLWILEDKLNWVEHIPDYEILAYRDVSRPFGILEGMLLTQAKANGNLHEAYQPYRVKCLSTNTEFTVGDDIIACSGTFTILSFRESQNAEMVLNLNKVNGYGNSILIQNAKKAERELMFTTEDQIKVYKGDKTKVYAVSKEYNFSTALYEIDNTTFHYLPERNWYFATIQNVEIFINKHRKPILTTHDGVMKYQNEDVFFVWDRIIQPNGYTRTYLGSCNSIKLTSAFTVDAKHKYFHCKDKAKEYIVYNDACLSINDIATVYVTANRKALPVMVNGKKLMKMGKQPEALLNMVKRKMQL